MAKVKLNDVAIEARETWKQSKTDVPVVGLEHLEPDEIWLKRWDLNPDENTFTKGFRKGQLLFGRRRAYQKKMSVASCDGICSGDITVIAARPEKILPELLPFYLRTDSFFDFAVRGSGGSLSPRVKWSHISDYEFDLPPMEEQKKLAELLWAANDLKEKYKKAITATDEMLKAKFREMFGDVVGNEKQWQLMPVKEFATVRIGPFGSLLHAEDYVEGGHLIVNPCHMGEKGFEPDFSQTIDDNKYDELSSYVLKQGDLVLGRRGEIGRCVLMEQDGVVCGTGSLFVRINGDCDPRYLVRVMKDSHFRVELEKKAIGTTMKNINATIVEDLLVPLPPLSLQREFVAIADKAELAKANLKKSIAAIETLIKGLLN